VNHMAVQRKGAALIQTQALPTKSSIDCDRKTQRYFGGIIEFSILI